MSGSASDLDKEFLLELLEGDKVFAEELLDTYCQSASANLAEAERLIRAGQHETLYLPFHTLKGSSASIGLTGVRDLARELEKNAREGLFSLCEERLGDLCEAVKVGQGAFRSFLETL